MRTAFLLGLIGGIFGILGSFVYLTVGAFVSGFGYASINDVYAGTFVGLVGSTMGIVGGVVSGKKSGILMIGGSLITLLATSAFGILAFILLIIGGVVALREKPASFPSPPNTVAQVPPPPPQVTIQSPSIISAQQGQAMETKFCEFCGTKMPKIAGFCPTCGRQQL